MQVPEIYRVAPQESLTRFDWSLSHLTSVQFNFMPIWSTKKTSENNWKELKVHHQRLNSQNKQIA